MKSILVLTIDALSKWYIDNAAESAPYLNSISNSRAKCFNNVFSEGPFTEAAISGCWYGKRALEGWNYLVENDYSNTSIFETFKLQYKEVYVGKLVPFYSEKFSETNRICRENPVARAFEHVWRGRLQYYCNLESSSICDADYLSVEHILDAFFNSYNPFSDEVAKESVEYKKDKRKYVQNIFEEKVESRFFKKMDSSMFFLDSEKGYVEFQNRVMNPLNDKEVLLCDKIKTLNRLRLCNINSDLYSKSEIADVLDTPINRCVVSNDNAASMLRNGYETLPKLGEELEDFIEWYDQRGRDCDFFGYIHNYDFHYPEDFMNCRYDVDEMKYYDEIADLNESLSVIPNCAMSISKQLTIQKIDATIKRFVEELERRGFFENSVLVLTADHGITNFMYPTRRNSEERWNYLATNFNVPLYVFDGKNHGNDDSLYSASVIPGMLSAISQEKNIKSKSNTFLVCSWINGVPDFLRNSIRLGYRSLRESATIQLAYTQFIISSQILGLYDIVNDSDEIRDLKYSCGETRKKEVLSHFFDEWERIVREYLLGEGECKIYKSNNSSIIRLEWDYLCKFNKEMECFERKTFFSENSLIIVCGEGDNLLRFISELPRNVKVLEVWRIDGEDPFEFGLTCYKIGERDNQDIPVVIVSKKEIDYVAILHSKGFKKYILSSQLT